MTTFQQQHSYCVYFSVQYQTTPGEEIYVIGSIPELGNWKERVCKLTWTEGHVWVLDEPIVTTAPYFRYKYQSVKKDHHEHFRWETGVDRIAELRLLEKIDQPSYARGMPQYKQGDAPFYAQSKQVSGITGSQNRVELKDEWQSFLVRFSIYFPFDERNEEVFIEIDRLGTQPLKLQRAQSEYDWMGIKYGERMRPWECIVKLANDVSGDEGMFSAEHRCDINYKYLTKNRQTGQIVQEREPNRTIVLEQPHNYRGEFGNRGYDDQCFAARSFFVNGVINKTDSNFLNGFFVSEINNSGIIIGPYPIFEIDVDEACLQKKAKAVLNIQTREEIVARGVDQLTIEKFYRSKGVVQIVNHEIEYEDEQQMFKQYAEAAQRLNNLINDRGLKVYLHDTSSITRAPTVAVIYMCLFLRHQDW